ncbi:phage tail tape measure C-terminal domain-containing protein [Mesoterricola silvestris]|uniref:Tape measure domain-containing protein n=1 Tax=Mesoterricola silvestris TaxID=2927979 RepID=A0AA48GMT5_9BACT|nr:tape measure protein [Mesoterricola silvestris]BDU72400.1 hypothetical protein METEAL_15740 [Mesoterricola silvestris]
MPDLARLTIAVDHTQVAEGDKKLGALATTADRAEASLAKMGRVMAGLGVVAGLGIAAKQVYSTNAEFERLNTSLVTVMKSQARANQVFGELTDFAAKTPFQLGEVTSAYIMMRARGLDPTMTTMTSLGNLASGMGRSFQDTIGAVGSLAAGEIEPMKQLGFSVMTIGDQVRLSSGGVSETVSRNAYEISKAVARISDVKFAGGMERQIETLGGAFSNLQDQVSASIYKMGQGGFNENVRVGMQELTRSISDATPAATAFFTSVVSGSVDSVKWLGEHRNAVLSLGSAYLTLRAGLAYGSVVSEFGSPKTGSDAGLGSKLRGMTDYLQSLKMARIESVAYAENEVRNTAITLASAQAQRSKATAIAVGTASAFEAAAVQRMIALQEAQVTAATEAHTVALAKQALAQRANTVAAGAGSLATTGFKTIVTALGGPISATVTALVAAGTAAYFFRDSFKSSATSALEESKKLTEQLDKELIALKERNKARAEGKNYIIGAGDADIQSIVSMRNQVAEAEQRVAALKANLATASRTSSGSVYGGDSGETEFERITAELDQENATLTRLNASLTQHVNRLKAVQVEKQAASDAAAEASRKESEAQAKKAKEEMAAQLRAQEAQKLVEEHKTSVRDLTKKNIVGLAELQMPFGGAATSEIERSIAELYANAKRLKYTASEMRLVDEQVRQMREKASGKLNYQAAEDSRADEQKRLRDSLDLQYAQAKAAENFMFAEADAATRLRDEDAKLSAQKAVLNQLYQDGNVTMPEYRDRMMELERQAHIMTGTFGDLRDTINNWASDSANSFVDFCFTGKNAFGDLITSMLKDLARLAVQKNITEPLFAGFSSWLGSLGGGGNDFTPTLSTVNVPPLATGTNYVPQDMLALIHEGEAVVPKQYNTGATGAVQNLTVQINIDRSGSATTTTKGEDDAMSKRLIERMRGVAQEELYNAQRAGGMMAGGR